MELLPDNSGENPDLFRLDKKRLAMVDQNQQAIVSLLDELGYDGALLSLPENFSWFTCGGDSRFQAQSENTQVALFITRQGRVVLTHDAISPQLFDREIAALGFQLKERSWLEPVEDLYDEITRGRSVISDSGVGRTRCMEERISQLRAEFSPSLERKWKNLGVLATYAVEATCRSLKRNVTEAEVAGEVAHRSIKKGIIPVVIQVFADERLRRYRHWSHSRTAVKKRCVVNLIARKNGLHFAVSRSVSFSMLSPREQEEYQLAAEVLAEILPHVKSGVSHQQLWQELKSICKLKQLGNQWRAAEFAWQLGYRHPEQVFKPLEAQFFSSHTPWYWQSVLGSTMLGHSFIVRDTTPQSGINSDRWPVREFDSPDGTGLLLPEILIRED